MAASAPALSSALHAQETGLPPERVPLQDLSAFRSPGSNWQVVGGVRADLGRDQRLITEPGTGVLVNLAPSGRGENLFTSWEHGDLELELEFMMARRSNSGIYLQGRYEVQLIDSWGAKDPTYGDVGGIYQRWDPQRGRGREGFEGRAPRINAARAPGLWQTLRIRFQAPRFDAQGRKIANARFVRVELNGAVIHENVEVTGPTRGPAYESEGPTGPIMIQGDHGPVAFRNIRYKRYGTDRVEVSDLRYRVYEGTWERFPDLASMTPVREGRADAIASSLAGVQDKWALEFEGSLEAPVAGTYHFDLNLDWIDDDPHFQGVRVGGARLEIGGREVLLNEGLVPGAAGQVSLTAGSHPFRFVVYKNRPWTNRMSVALNVEGPQVERHPLHATLASPARLPNPILVRPEGEPTVLRSFVRHGETKRTHAVSVGDPSGVHYSFDLGQGALLFAWRGPFMEATPMWHERGNDQTAIPLGSLLPLSGDPSLAFLAAEQAAWPDSAGADYAARGYALDDAGRPSFLYTLRGVEVEDRIRPAEDGASLRRELRLRAPDEVGGLYLRVAAGEEVRALSRDLYGVDDLTYYVSLDRGMPRPVVRSSGGVQELLIPVRFRGGAAELAYTITW